MWQSLDLMAGGRLNPLTSGAAEPGEVRCHRKTNTKGPFLFLPCLVCAEYLICRVLSRLAIRPLHRLPTGSSLEIMARMRHTEILALSSTPVKRLSTKISWVDYSELFSGVIFLIHLC
ncbi:Hypothetical protein NTJ_06090 [Nesidiocoris tenuis]|uniref:Uncharacterized protein n=1 Tax=Nesidiocoris tenuis TaxID=355587 RepID=A0ABN7AM09_9HEMI|nr:Hypothetical protein NTJ_06090 [Nesidiocoris tenuis]